MKQIILKVLSEIACGNTDTCQINMQAESAREMVADKLCLALEPYIQEQMQNVVEQAVCGDSFYGNE